LARDALVNQRLAIGGEGGDLSFDAIRDAFDPAELIVEKSANPFLFLE
jgi:hypothetical protein